MSTLGKRIRQRRDELALTQGDLAERVGVREPQISRWERDEVAPEARWVIPLADALGVTADYVLRDAGLPVGLAALVAQPDLLARPLDPTEIAWATNEVRSHGDVSTVEWVKRFNKRRRDRAARVDDVSNETPSPATSPSTNRSRKKAG